MSHRQLRLYLLLAVFLVVIEAFVQRSASTTSRQSRLDPVPSSWKPFTAAATSTTRLKESLWDRMGLEEGEEPYWYVLNCIAGLEPLLLMQCKQVAKDLPDAHRFVVPTSRTTRSHGAKRMVSETKVKFPGYVFAKLRMTRQVYEALSGLDLMRSFMGTINYKRQRRLPPIPIALNELEVENYGLEEWVDGDEEEHGDSSGAQTTGDDIVIVDSAEEEAKAIAKDQVTEDDLKVYKGLKVDDMVKVTKRSQYFGDDGVVRRLKEGQIFVRFYTYGSTFDVWMQPDDVRKLSNAEMLEGLSGPTRPITQEDFDGPSQERENRGTDLDSPRRQTNVVPGGLQQRNRRQDRTAAQFQQRDRRNGEGDAREERNWNWYQDQRRQGERSVTTADTEGRVFRARSTSENDKTDSEWAMGDADSQWGRKPERQQRRERDSAKARSFSGTGSDDWSSFVTPAKDTAPKKKSDSDDFFDSLVADLSKEKAGSGSQRPGRGGLDPSAEDDFFASLMTDISEATSNSDGDERRRSSSMTSIRSAPERQETSQDDDFFASLEQQLDEMNAKPIAATSSLEDDFFATLTQGDNAAAGAEESGLAHESRTRAKSSPSADKVNSGPSLSGDIKKMTIPALKVLLRERGLKVSGTKSELIDRLSSS